MPLLTLNGIEVPVTQASRAQLTVGKESRAFNGTHRLGRRGLRREWRFTTGPLAVDESAALRGLVEGQGESWGFDNTLYSDGGLGPAAADGAFSFASASYSGDTAKLPPILLGSTPVNRFVYQLDRPLQWTLLLCAMTPTYVGWPTTIRRSDGATWQNGVRDDALDLRGYVYAPATGQLTITPIDTGATAWAAGQVRAVGSRASASGHTYEVVQVTGDATTGTTNLLGTDSPVATRTYGITFADGNVTWKNIGLSNVRVSELAWLPYAVPDSWVAPLTAAFNTVPRFTLPQLVATGSFAPAPVIVLGEVVDAKAQQLVRNGALTIGEQVTFTLREV